jgi:hypothetical protein
LTIIGITTSSSYPNDVDLIEDAVHCAACDTWDTGSFILLPLLIIIFFHFSLIVVGIRFIATTTFLQ